MITNYDRMVILTLLILLTGQMAMGQLSRANQSPPPEPSQEYAECGDGVCQGVLTGVCPEDCGNSNNSEGEQNSSLNQNQTKTTSNKGDDRPILILAFIGALAFCVLIIFFWLRRKRKRSKQSNSERNREVERELRSRLRKGLNYRSAKEDMVSKGYDPEDVENARNYLDESFYSNNSV